MAQSVQIWLAPQADFLEVRCSEASGYRRATDHGAILERVDAKGCGDF